MVRKNEVLLYLKDKMGIYLGNQTDGRLLFWWKFVFQTPSTVFM